MVLVVKATTTTTMLMSVMRCCVLARYHPFLFLDPRAYLTMNETVLGLTSARMSPATIESTTLALMTGIDVFFTRVTLPRLVADFRAVHIEHVADS